MALSLPSCEGFKILTLQNASDHRAKVTIKTDPTIRSPHPASPRDSILVTYLEPDSSMTLHTAFTSLMFNLKIREHELPINYLKIETPNRSIEAPSKADIINLIREDDTKYQSKLDKEKRLSKGKSLNHIFIRN